MAIGLIGVHSSYTGNILFGDRVMQVDSYAIHFFNEIGKCASQVVVMEVLPPGGTFMLVFCDTWYQGYDFLMEVQGN